VDRKLKYGFSRQLLINILARVFYSYLNLCPIDESANRSKGAKRISCEVRLSYNSQEDALFMQSENLLWAFGKEVARIYAKWIIIRCWIFIYTWRWAKRCKVDMIFIYFKFDERVEEMIKMLESQTFYTANEEELNK
jgi:hypothetical protein